MLALAGDSFLYDGATLTLEGGGIIVNDGVMADEGRYPAAVGRNPRRQRGPTCRPVSAGETFGEPVTLAPGPLEGGIASLGFGDLTLDGGGAYAFDIADATGTGTPGVAWDLLDVAGSLAVTATAADPFTVLLSAAAGFDPAALAAGTEWVAARFAMFSGTFDPSAFRFDTGGLGAGFDPSEFTASLDGTNFVVAFAPAPVPEPGTTVLLCLAAAAAWIRRRRMGEA